VFLRQLLPQRTN